MLCKVKIEEKRATLGKSASSELKTQQIKLKENLFEHFFYDASDLFEPLRQLRMRLENKWKNLKLKQRQLKIFIKKITVIGPPRPPDGEAPKVKTDPSSKSVS